MIPMHKKNASCKVLIVFLQHFSRVWEKKSGKYRIYWYVKRFKWRMPVKSYLLSLSHHFSEIKLMFHMKKQLLRYFVFYWIFQSLYHSFTFSFIDNFANSFDVVLFDCKDAWIIVDVFLAPISTNKNSAPMKSRQYLLYQYIFYIKLYYFCW